MSPQAHTKLPDYSVDRSILRAQAVRRDLYTPPDIVISWSTDAGPWDLLLRCPPVIPSRLRQIEVVADEEIFMGDTENLLDKLRGRSIVRFNARDWSVVWMAETKTRGAQIQAIFKALPDAMVEMVRSSATGMSTEVDQFFNDLRAALAAA